MGYDWPNRRIPFCGKDVLETTASTFDIVPFFPKLLGHVLVAMLISPYRKVLGPFNLVDK